MLASGFDFVLHLDAAISNYSGEAQYLLTNGGGSRLDGNGKTIVRTDTLDNVLSNWDRVDLIKIDIEGAEVLAWEGMQETIDRNPGLIIVMEWEPGRSGYGHSYVASIRRKFPVIREIMTDGGLAVLSDDDLMYPFMRNLWLQK